MHDQARRTQTPGSSLSMHIMLTQQEEASQHSFLPELLEVSTGDVITEATDIWVRLLCLFVYMNHLVVGCAVVHNEAWSDSV